MRWSTPLGLASVVLLSGASVSTSSCGTRPPPPPNDSNITMGETTTEAPVEGRLRLMEPIALHGHESVLVPLAVENQARNRKSRDRFNFNFTPTLGFAARVSTDSGRTSGWESRPVRWHNALLSDLNTGESWKLLEQRGVVSQFSPAVPYEYNTETRQYEIKGPTKLIAFLVTTRDTTSDGALKSNDARVCIVTDGDGRNPRTITPDDLNVLSTRYDHERDLLWLQVIEDTDGDGNYSGLDDQFPMVFDPTKDEEARRLINAELVSEAEALLTQ